ncbi:Chitotriosidase-1 [Halotydeus destructor]|nr:Chitotriosidase-1 [Halotydeus destructor]
MFEHRTPVRVRRNFEFIIRDDISGLVSIHSSRYSSNMNLSYCVLFVLFIARSQAFVNNLNCHIGSLATRDVNLDRSLLKGCTFVVYHSVPVKNHAISINKDAADNLKNLTSFRDESKEFHVLMSLSGPEMALEMATIAGSQEARNTFIKSIMLNLEKHKLDGVVLNWRFPGLNRTGGHNITAVISELRDTLDKVGYFLGIHAAAQSWYTSSTSEPLNISDMVDFVDLHTFDYYGPWESIAYHHAPLRQLNYTTGAIDHTIDGSIQSWLQDGVDRSKVNLGVSTYGWIQQLVDESNSEPFAKTNGGRYSYLPLSDSCVQNYTVTTPIGWDAPIGVLGKKWLSFENQKSMVAKIDYAREKQLGGIAFYTIDSDDRFGLCKLGRSPLLKTVVESMEKSAIPKLIKTGLKFDDIYPRRISSIE